MYDDLKRMTFCHRNVIKINKYGLQFYTVRGWSCILFLIKNFIRTLNLLNFKQKFSLPNQYII